MADWKFGRREGCCGECENAFQDGDAHHSLLCLTETGFGRSDVCPACFEQLDLSEEVVWWRTRHTVAEKKGVQLDLESIHALFEALEEREQRGWRELRYLLCLILLRKRRLKVLSVKRIDGDEVFVVRRPRRQDEKLVFVFDFSAERRSELRDTLHAIFEGADLDELDPEGAGGATVGEAGGDAVAESADGVEVEGAPENGEAGVDPVGV